MAQASVSSLIVGLCTTTLHIGDAVYHDVKLCILPSLCSDVILGLDFMQQQKGLKIRFGGALEHSDNHHKISVK